MPSLPKISPNLIKKYQEELAGSFSEATLKRKSISLKKFLDWASKNDPRFKIYGTLAEAEANNQSKITEKSAEKFFGKPGTKGTPNNWYRRYQNTPGIKYLNISVLIILIASLGFGIYNQFFKNATRPLAFPASLVRPNRYLSFQGRLTSNFGNPITAATNVVFKLYDNSSGGSTLWNSGTCSISPDTDGVFSTLLGSSCGTELTSDIFSQNAAVWLGVTVATDPEALPRIQIATVAYALNSETLQGYPASSSATINTVPVVNNSGQIVLALSSPKILSTSGTFAIEGQAVTIDTPSASNGSINISPDGTGSANFIFNGASPGNGNGMINATDANLTSGSLYYGSIASNAAGYNLLQLQSGSTLTNKFVVDYSGNASASGNLTLAGGARSIQTTLFGNLTLGGTTTGNILLSPSNNIAGGYVAPNTTNVTDLGTSSLLWRNIYGTTVYQGGNQVCDTGGNCTGSGIVKWRENAGTLSPYSGTLDVLIGSNATSSAKFAFINVNTGTPTASISGTTANVATFIDGNGNISSTNRNNLTLGNSATYNTTGNILLNSNGTGLVGIGTTLPAAQLEVLGTGSGTVPDLKASNGYIDLPAGLLTPNTLAFNDLIMYLPFNYTADTSRKNSPNTYTRADTNSGSTATYTNDVGTIITANSQGFVRTEKAYTSRGIWIEDTRRNELLQSSFESGTPPTGWTAGANVTPTQVSSFRKHSSNAVQLVSAAGGAWTYTRNSANTLVNTSTYPLSAYVFNNTSGAIGGTIDATVVKLYASADLTTTYTNVGGGWWLLKATVTGDGTATQNIGVDVMATGKTIIVDAIQLEATTGNAGVTPFPTTYIYTTTGVADRGTTAERLNYQTISSTGIQQLTNNKGTISFWFKPEWASSDPTASDKMYFVEAGTSTCKDATASNCIVKIYFNGADQKMYAALYNSTDYTTAQISSAALSFTALSNHYVSFRWDSTISSNNLVLNVDGVETTGSAASWTPPALSTSNLLNIGSPADTGTPNNANRADALISDFGVFSRMLTTAEVAQIYNSKAPIQDPERADQVMLVQSTSYEQQIGSLRLNGTIQGNQINGTNFNGNGYAGFAASRQEQEAIAAIYPFNFTLTNTKGDGGTFTRADANGTYEREPDLQLVAAASGIPRFERGDLGANYNSYRGPGSPGIWIEDSRKNVSLYSSFEALTGWALAGGSGGTGANLTAAQNTTFFLNGSNSVGITVNSTNANNSVYYQTINFTGFAVNHQISAYVYLGTSGSVGNAPTSSNIQLYAAAGAPGASPAGLATTYTPVGKGWYRMTATFTATSASWSVGVEIPSGAAANQITYVDAFQVERMGSDAAANYPTNYIPTTSTAVTRALETLTYTAPSGLVPDRGSVSLWFKPQYAQGTDTTNKYLFTITNYLRAWVDGTNSRIEVDAWNGASWVSLVTNSNSINRYGWNNLVISWNANGSTIAYINTNSNSSGTSWTPQNPAGQTLYVGSDGSGANQANALISELAFYNRILDSTEIAQIYYNMSQLTDLYNTVTPILQNSTTGLQLTQTGDFNISGRFLGGTGSASLPTFGFGTNTNTGIFSGGTNILAFTTNGTERAFFDASGNFVPFATDAYNLGTSSSVEWNNIYGKTIWQGANQVCDTGGNCSSVGNYWRLASNVLAPVQTAYDLVVGGNATGSAFQVFGAQTAAGDAVKIISNVVATGDVFEATSSAITSGDMIHLGEGGNQAFTGNGINMDFDNTGGGGGAFTGKFLNFANAGTNKYFVDSAGNASQSGNLTLGNGSAIQPAFGPLTLNYKSGANAWSAGITLQDTTGNVGIGTTAPAAKLSVTGGQLYVNATGTTNILMNSAGQWGTIQNDAANIFSLGYRNSISTALGTPVLSWNTSNQVGIATISPTATLDVNGNASVSGTLAFHSGTGTIQSTTFSPLVIGGNTTGNITLNPSNAIAGGYVAPNTNNVTDLGISGTAWRNIYGTTIYQGANQVCDAGGAVVGCNTTNYWRLASNVLAPVQTAYDLVVGGNATGSAWQVFGAQTAAGDSEKITSSVIASGNLFEATSSGITTGNIINLGQGGTTAFSGNGLQMNFNSYGGGAFTGNYLKFNNNGLTKYLIDPSGNSSQSGNLTLGYGSAIQSAYGPVTLNYKSGANTWTSGLTLTNSGSVGIGTTNPSGQLQVVSSSGDSVIYVGPSAVSASAGIQLVGNNSGTPNYASIYAGWNGNLLYSPAPAAGSIGHQFNKTDGSSAVVITGTGSLGVGTTTPTALLDVNGNASVSGTLAFHGGTGTIQSTTFSPLVIGGNITGNITLSPSNDIAGGFVAPNVTNVSDLGLASKIWRNIYGTTVYQGTHQVCDTSGNCGGIGGYWQLNSLVLSPNNTTYDLTIGGSATGSAFQVFGAQTAAGDLTKLTSSVVATGNVLEATSSALTTGDIFHLNQAGTTAFSGNAIHVDINNFGGGAFTGNFLSFGRNGSTVYSLDNAGNSSQSGNIFLANGARTIQTLATSGLTIGGSTTGNITLDPLNHVAGGFVAPNTTDVTDLGTSSLEFRNVYSNNLITNNTGTAALYNTNATTLNIGGAATLINLLGASGTDIEIGNANTTTGVTLTSGDNAQRFKSSQTTGTKLNGSFVFKDLALSSGDMIYATSGGAITSGTLLTLGEGGNTSFTGNVLFSDIANGGGGAFTGNFLKFNNNGLTQYLLDASGNSSQSGNIVLANGARTIQSTATSGLTIGGSTTGNITLNPLNAVAGGFVAPNTTNVTDLGTSSLLFRNIYGTTLYQGVNQVCDTGGNCSSVGNYWRFASNVLAPVQTAYDLVVGGNATGSAWQVFGAQTAAGDSEKITSSVIASGNLFEATSSGITTGNIINLGQGGTTAFSGNGLQMNFNSYGGGAFTGNYLKFNNNGLTQYLVDATGNASESGNLTLGNGSTIKPAYGPLTLSYKSGLNAWTTGFTLTDTTGNAVVAQNLAVNGGALTTTQTTATLFDTTATTLSLGSAATTALNLGNGNTAYTAINLGSGTGGNTINIGNGANAATQIVNIANGAAGANSTVNILGGVATTGTQTLNLGTGASAKTLNLGNATGATAVNVTSGNGSQTFTSSVATGTLTSGAFVFKDTALTQGDLVYATASAITSGNVLKLGQSGTSAFSGNGLLMDFNSYGGGAFTGNYLTLNNNGLTQYTIGPSGSSSQSGTITLGGTTAQIQSTATRSLTIGGSTTGNITLNPLNAVAGGFVAPNTTNVTDLGTSSLLFRNIYGTTLYQGVNQVCDTGGNCSSVGNYWRFASNVLAPVQTAYDLVVGGNATGSAWQVFGAQTAAGDSEKITSSVIATGNLFEATSSGITTGNIINLGQGGTTAFSGNGLQMNFNSYGGGAFTGNYLKFTNNGLNQYLVDSGGNSSQSGNIVLANGARSIQSTATNGLTIGGATTGNITLNPLNAVAGGFVAPNTTNVTDLGTSSLLFRNIYGTNIFQGVNQVCDSAGNHCPSGAGLWQLNSLVLSPSNTTYDLTIGGNATGSAYQVFGAQTAAGDLEKLTSSVIATGNLYEATSSGITTGNIIKLGQGGTTAFSGNGLLMNFNSYGGGAFTGNYLKFTNNGLTEYLVDPSGNSSQSGNIVLANGARSIQSTATSGLTIGGATTGNITLNPLNAVAGGYVAPNTTNVTDLGTSSLLFRNIYGTTLYQGVNQVCDVGGNCTGSSIVKWRENAGTLSPYSGTLDVLIGSNATSSAKFAFINTLTGTPTASISGTTANVATFIDGNGNISSTNSNNLTLGNSATYNSTGNILLSPNGNGNVGIGLTLPDVKLSVAGTIKSFASSIGNMLTNNGTTGVVGTVTNHALQLYTNNSVKATIDTSGNFGIGTTSPTALLDVNGNASVSGTLAFHGGTGTIQSTTFSPLVIGGSTTGNITLNPSNGIAGGFVAPNTTNVTDLGTSSLMFRNIYANTATLSGTLSLGPMVQGLAGTCNATAAGKEYYDGVAQAYYYCNGTIWTQIGSGSGTNYWQLNSNVLSPANTTYDLTVGGSATGSAWQVFGSQTAAGDVEKITSSVITTGNLYEATSSAITSGNMIKLGEGGNQAFTGNGLFMDFDNTGGGGGAFTGNFLKFNDAFAGASTTVFNVASTGNETIASTGTSGNILGISAAGATTLTAALTGMNLDLSTNYTATGFNVTGAKVLLPTVTNTGAGTYAYSGISITGNPITQSTAAGTDTWTGLGITMPNLTQNTGSVTGYGLSLTGAQFNASASATALFINGYDGDAIKVNDGAATTFQLADAGVTTFKPTGFTKVYECNAGANCTAPTNSGTGVTYIDETTEASTSAGTAQTAWTVGVPANTSLYVGLDHPFTTIYYAAATPATPSATMTVQYFDNSNNWLNVNTVTANNTIVSGVPLAQTGQVTFNLPTTWQAASVNGTMALYWIRISTNTNPGTVPTFYSISPTTGNRFYNYAMAGDSNPTLYINDLGNVGVGTNSPAAKFDIKDFATTTGNVFDATASAITSGNILNLAEGGNQTFSGNTIFADMDNTGGGGGAFTGNFLKFNNAGITNYLVDYGGNASESGNLTIGNGSTIRPAYGPLTLSYKAGPGGWNVGFSLTDTTGVATVVNDLNSTSATANLFNLNTTNLTFAGAATTLNIGPTGSGASSILLSGGYTDTGCTISGATGHLACTGSLQIGAAGDTQLYSRFGSNDADHLTNSAADLLLSGRTEFRGTIFLDSADGAGGGALSIADYTGQPVISLPNNPLSDPHTLTGGSWLVDNGSAQNYSQAALVVNQESPQDIFSASASGTTRLEILNNGTTIITSSHDSTTATLQINDTSGTGLGKIDVGTVDPPYTINGTKYATYMAGMVGVKEEVTGQAQTSEYIPGVGYRYVVDFNNLPTGSDLWLFGKATDMKTNIGSLVALLTPQDSTRTWYQVDKTNAKLAIYSASPTTISYRLSGPRFDYQKFPNQRSVASTSVGFVINSLDTINNSPIVTTIQELAGFTVEKLQNGVYSLRDASGTIVDGLESTGNFVAANIKSGAIQTQELATSSFTAFQGTVDNLLVTSGLVAGNIQTNLISPIPGNTDVTVQIGSVATPSGKFAIQNSAGDEVASIDNQGNATFSGTVRSQNIDQIQALLTQVSADQSVLLAATSSADITSSGSANLSQLITSDLYVTGQAAINSLSVANSLTIGSDTIFAEDTLNSISAPLKLQSLAMAPVEIMDGLVTIDTHGNVNIAGDLNVAGRIHSSGLTLQDSSSQNVDATSSAQLLSLQNQGGTEVAGVNSSGSAQFNSLTTPQLVIAGADASASGTIVNGAITTNSTVGQALIPAGISEITIINPKVTDYTLVYVTPTSTTSNNVLYVKSKQNGQFVVGFDQALPIDVKFNWWIIQVSQ